MKPILVFIREINIEKWKVNMNGPQFPIFRQLKLLDSQFQQNKYWLKSDIFLSKLTFWKSSVNLKEINYIHQIKK